MAYQAKENETTEIELTASKINNFCKHTPSIRHRQSPLRYLS